MKKLIPFLLALVLVLTMATTAFAASNVTLDGESEKFVFAPGSKYSLTDLFTNFKGVMPGDKLTQKVTVKNTVDDKADVKIYMRALGAHADSVKFLNQMDLTVTASSGNTALFQAAADQSAQLTEWTCLGTFKPGAEIDLDVTLEVPVEMDNEFQNAVGYLDWQFKAEILPIPETPKTGDTSNLLLYGGLAVVSLLALVAVVVIYKKRKAA